MVSKNPLEEFGTSSFTSWNLNVFALAGSDVKSLVDVVVQIISSRFLLRLHCLSNEVPNCMRTVRPEVSIKRLDGGER